MDPTQGQQQPIIAPAAQEQMVPVEQPKRHYGWLISIILVLILLAGGSIWYALTRRPSILSPLLKPSVVSSSTITPAQIKTIDLSPGTPSSEKTVVDVQLSDSSFEKIIMATSLVARYIKTLPEGDKIISQTPLAP